MPALKSQPEFEAETTAETATKESTMSTETTKTADTSAEKIAAATKAAAAASNAIAKASTSSTEVAVAKPAAKFQVAFADKNGVFDTATVEGLSLAAPRVKGEQGSLFKGDVDLGGKARLELISFNHRWAIGTGEDDKEATDFFRVSYDNKTLSGNGGGADLADYVESLKAQGFTKAKSSPYLDVWGFITWSEKTGDVPMDQRELVCLQCSQTSLGAFTAFATTRGLLESKGMAKPIDVIEIHAEKRASGTNKYTNFSFHVPAAQ